MICVCFDGVVTLTSEDGFMPYMKYISIMKIIIIGTFFARYISILAQIAVLN